MELSVVIISWNSRAFLEDCIDSLLPMLDRVDTELIWVDNGSTDGAYEMMAQKCPQARLIRLDHNYGVAYARNRGIEASTGRYILILDDDTKADPAEIDKLLDYIKEHDDVGICGPSLSNDDKVLQASFKDYPGVGVKIHNVVCGLLRIEKKTQLPAGPIEPCYIIGACQMIRRAVIDRCGLLDQNIFYGPEDADMCMRARADGWRVVYLPHISVTHNWRRITNRKFLSKTARQHIKGLIYLYKKYRRVW